MSIASRGATDPAKTKTRDDDAPNENSGSSHRGSAALKTKAPRSNDLRHLTPNHARDQDSVLWTPFHASRKSQVDDGVVTSWRQMIHIENRPSQYDDKAILEWHRESSHDDSVSSGLSSHVDAVDQLRGSLVRLFFGWYGILEANLDAALSRSSRIQPGDDEYEDQMLNWKELVVLVVLMLIVGQALSVLIALEWILRLAWTPRYHSARTDDKTPHSGSEVGDGWDAERGSIVGDRACVGPAFPRRRCSVRVDTGASDISQLL